MEMANKSAQSGGNCSANNCDVVVVVVVWRGGGGGGRRRGLIKGEQEVEEERGGGGAGDDLTVKCGFCSSADCAQNGLFKMTTIDGSSSSSSSSSASGSLSSCRLLERHNLSSSSSPVSRQLFDFLPFVTSIFVPFRFESILSSSDY
jgi:hypothetical protein